MVTVKNALVAMFLAVTLTGPVYANDDPSAIEEPMSAVANETDDVVPFLTATGLLLPGSFVGTLPCADCEGIAHHLDLWPDQVYHMRREWLGRSDSRDEIGRWYADPVEGTIVLFGAAEMPLFWDVEGTDAVRARDILGNPIESSLNYTLNRLETFEPIELEALFMGGMFTYLADAAVFQECLSGRSYPVATEGDYLALERAYLGADVDAGDPIYASIEGGLLNRPAMEGPDREHVVITRLAQTWTDRSCEQNRATAALENTYWRIETLDGNSVSAVPDRREPHIVLRSGDEASFSATIGCNQFVGAYTSSDTDLAFGPAAGTRMACPPGLDADEQRLAGVLTNTVAHRREGETLALYDAEGEIVAVLRAVYFR